MKQVNTIHVSPKEYLNCILPINTTIQRRMRNGRQKTAIKEEKEGENIPGGDTIIHKIEKKERHSLPPLHPSLIANRNEVAQGLQFVSTTYLLITKGKVISAG